MKRMIAYILSVCLLLSLTACGEQNVASEDKDSSLQSGSVPEESSGNSSENVSAESEASEPDKPQEGEEAVEVDPLPCNTCTAAGTLVSLTTSKDFSSCTLSHLEPVVLSVDNPENVSLRLTKDGEYYFGEGFCLSPTLPTQPFSTAIASWDADLPSGTTLEVEARLLENVPTPEGDSKSEWSGWFSWGEYGPSIHRASKTSRDDYALMNIDTLTPTRALATAVQLRVTLRTSDVTVTPVLRAVYLTIQNEAEPFATGYGQPLEDADWQKVLNVSPISQMERYSLMAENICSPTSISMLLGYAGTSVLPEVAAMNAYDNGANLFGNWSYNASFAGLYGYDAFVIYTDLDGLQREIASGHPAALSVAYTNEENGDGSLAYIEGAPLTTSGHLIVLCGFTEKDGELYAVVNDPAAETSETVRREYKLDQLLAAWTGVAYFVRDREPGAGESLEVRELELRPAEDGYKLYFAGEDTPFSYNAGSVCVLIDGTTLQYPHPVHGGLLLYEEMPVGSTLWIVTDLGLLYRAEVPEKA